MALRECPRCREMIRASSTRCRACGNELEPVTLVKADIQQCPLCGQLAAPGAAACDCGYDFSTRPIDLRTQLVRRKRYAWLRIVVGLAVVIGIGATWMIVGRLPILPTVGIAACGAAVIARGIQSIAWTRGELAQLEARDRALPAARLIE